MKKRMMPIFVSACMVLSMSTTALAADFADTEGHWAEDAIERWSDVGVVNGVSNDRFEPDGELSRAQAAQVFTNLLKLDGAANISAYEDIDQNAWYADAIAACVEKGILNGVSATAMNPNGTITREMFFTMFARALGIPEDSSLNRSFSDTGDIADWARGSIYALINRGFINGLSDSTIAPQVNIDRASVMTLLDQSIIVYANKNGAVTADANGIVLVLADEVTISGNGNVTVVVANADSSIDFSDMGGDVEIIVLEDDVTITNAPESTTITVSEGVTGTTVNGQSVDGGEEITIQPTGQTTGGGSSGGNGGGGGSRPDPDPDEPDNPDNPNPDEPVELPDGSIEFPDGTIEKPDGTIEKPDGTIETPDGTIEWPDGTVEKPDGTIEKPDGTIEKPDGTIEKPDGTIEKPDGTIEKPDGTIEKPAGTIEKPDGTIEEPAGGVEEA